MSPGTSGPFPVYALSPLHRSQRPTLIASEELTDFLLRGAQKQDSQAATSNGLIYYQAELPFTCPTAGTFDFYTSNAHQCPPRVSVLPYRVAGITSARICSSTASLTGAYGWETSLAIAACSHRRFQAICKAQEHFYLGALGM